MTSKGRKFTVGNVRLKKNAYGNKKLHSIHTKYRSKDKPHTVISNLSATSKRKGTLTSQKSYSHKKYVGRKSSRRIL